MADKEKEYDIVPITLTEDCKYTHDCYMDKKRQHIFPSYITTELAKILNWTWEEKNNG